MQSQVEEWPEVKKMFEKYNDFAKDIHNKTGELYYPTSKLYKLYNNLRAAVSVENFINLTSIIIVSIYLQ